MYEAILIAFKDGVCDGLLDSRKMNTSTACTIFTSIHVLNGIFAPSSSEGCGVADRAKDEKDAQSKCFF